MAICKICNLDIQDIDFCIKICERCEKNIKTERYKKYRTRVKKWIENNSEKNREYKKQYKIRNRDKLLENKKKRAIKNKEIKPIIIKKCKICFISGESVLFHGKTCTKCVNK